MFSGRNQPIRLVSANYSNRLIVRLSQKVVVGSSPRLRGFPEKTVDSVHSGLSVG